MKKRIFYVINLDRSRILTLAAFFSGFLILSFASGYYLGTSDSGSRYETDSIAQEAIPEPDSLTEDSEPAKTESTAYDTEREISDRSEPENIKGIPLRSLADPVVSRDENERSDRNKSVTVAKKSESSSKNKKESTGAPILKQKSPVRLANVKTEKESKTPQKRASGPTKRIYAFQVGAFNTDAAAERMVNQLKKDGFEPYTVSSGTKKLVRIGKADSRKGLSSVEKKLKSSKQAHFLIVD